MEPDIATWADEVFRPHPDPDEEGFDFESQLFPAPPEGHGYVEWYGWHRGPTGIGEKDPAKFAIPCPWATACGPICADGVRCIVARGLGQAVGHTVPVVDMSEAIPELLQRYVKDHPSEADDFEVDGDWKQVEDIDDEALRRVMPTLTWRFLSQYLWAEYDFRQALQEHVYTYHFGQLPPQFRGAGMKHLGKHNAEWKQWEPDTEPDADVRAASAAGLNVATYYRTGPKRAGEAAERGGSQQPPDEQPGGTQEEAFATQPRAAAGRPAGGTRHAAGVAEAVKRRRTMDPATLGLAPGKTPRLPAAPAIVKTEVPTPPPAHVINAAAAQAAAAAEAAAADAAGAAAAMMALANGGSAGGDGASAPPDAAPERRPPLKDRGNVLPAAGHRTSAVPAPPGAAKVPAAKGNGGTRTPPLTSSSSPSLLHWSTGGHGLALGAPVPGPGGPPPAAAAAAAQGSDGGGGPGASKPPAQPSQYLCRIPLARSEGPNARPFSHRPAGPDGPRVGRDEGMAGGSAAPGVGTHPAGAKAGPSGPLSTVAPAAQLAGLASPGGARLGLEQKAQQMKADFDELLSQALQAEVDRAGRAAAEAEANRAWGEAARAKAKAGAALERVAALEAQLEAARRAHSRVKDLEAQLEAARAGIQKERSAREALQRKMDGMRAFLQ